MGKAKSVEAVLDELIRDTQFQSHNAVSGMCADDLHEGCNWAITPDYILYCSCECHQEARAMPAAKKDTSAAEAQEIEAADDPYIAVPLAGYDGVVKDVRALPAGKWRASATRALNSGDLDAFMQKVLHEDDFEVFEDLDPDMEAIGHFAQKAAEASGDDLGKSSGPSRSSRSTRRR